MPQGTRRIRGKEVSIQVIVDGKQQIGSFAKVENYKLTPRMDLTDSDFLGEKTSEPDIMHHGFDFSFTVHEADANCAELLDKIVSNEENGSTHPSINIVVRTTYRDPALSPRVEVLQKCIMKPDDQTVGGRKDYTKWSYTGKCRTRKKLNVA